MNVQTVFLVDGEAYKISGTGQSAVASALDQFKNKVVKLHGFLINDVFQAVNLAPDYNRNKK